MPDQEADKECITRYADSENPARAKNSHFPYR